MLESSTFVNDRDALHSCRFPKHGVKSPYLGNMTSQRRGCGATYGKSVDYASAATYSRNFCALPCADAAIIRVHGNTASHEQHPHRCKQAQVSVVAYLRCRSRLDLASNQGSVIKAEHLMRQTQDTPNDALYEFTMRRQVPRVREATRTAS